MPIKPRFQVPFRVVDSRRSKRPRPKHLELIPPPPEEDLVMEEARAAFERLFEQHGA